MTKCYRIIILLIFTSFIFSGCNQQTLSGLTLLSSESTQAEIQSTQQNSQQSQPEISTAVSSELTVISEKQNAPAASKSTSIQPNSTALDISQSSAVEMSAEQSSQYSSAIAVISQTVASVTQSSTSYVFSSSISSQVNNSSSESSSVTSDVMPPPASKSGSQDKSTQIESIKKQISDKSIELASIKTEYQYKLSAATSALQAEEARKPALLENYYKYYNRNNTYPNETARTRGQQAYLAVLNCGQKITQYQNEIANLNNEYPTKIASLETEIDILKIELAALLN